MSNQMTLEMLIKAQNTAQKQINQVSKQIKGVTSTMEKQQKVAKKGASVFKKAWAVKAVAIYGTFRVLKSVTTAYMEQERAEKRLETLTKNVIGTTNEHIEALKEQARAMQKITTIGDEVTMAGQSQLATFQLQADTINQLTPSLLDLAVAVYGVNVQQQDMINISNLLGKAMLGQTGALTRYGITMDEVQTQILQTGTEAERTAVTIEILGQNFGGLAEEMRNTLEGRLEVVKNQFGDLREEIGEKLAPVITKVLIWVSEVGIPMAERAMNNLSENWTNNLWNIKTVAETTGGAIMFIIDGWIKGIQTAGILLNKLNNEITGAKMAKRATDSALALAPEGKEQEYMNLARENVQGLIDTATSSFNIEEEMAKAFQTKSLSGFSSGASAKMAELQELLGGSSDGSSSGSSVGTASALQEQLATRIGKTRDAWRAMTSDAKVALSDLESAHKTRIGEINSNIDELKNSLATLKDTYNSTIAGLDMSTANEIINQEEKIKALQDEISEGRSNGDNVGALTAQLNAEKQALEKFKATSIGLEDEISEARRRNSLTDFERFIEDQESKRTEAETDFNNNQSMVEAEIQALEDQKTQEQAIYESKRSEYLETLDVFNQFKTGYIDGLMAMETRTETSVKILESRLGRLQNLLSEIQATESEAGISTSSSAIDTGSQSTSNQINNTNSPTVSVTINAQEGSNSSDIATAVKTELDKFVRSMQQSTLGIPSTS